MNRTGICTFAKPEPTKVGKEVCKQIGNIKLPAVSQIKKEYGYEKDIIHNSGTHSLDGECLGANSYGYS